jgi:hypothetical protein
MKPQTPEDPLLHMSVEDREEIVMLKKCLTRIPERDRKIAEENWFKGTTTTELAKMFELSRTRVSQVLKKDLKIVSKLMKRLQNGTFITYWQTAGKKRRYPKQWIEPVRVAHCTFCDVHYAAGSKHNC